MKLVMVDNNLKMFPMYNVCNLKSSLKLIIDEVKINQFSLRKIRSSLKNIYKYICVYVCVYVNRSIMFHNI